MVAHKCAARPDVFSHICLASRTLSKCQRIASELSRSIEVETVNADCVEESVRLMRTWKPDLLIHVALPYQDLSLMDACLEAGVHYVDTANYEPRDEPTFSYERQWPYHQAFKERGLTALLGSGFDPGVTNVFCAYAQKHLFDEIHTVDILDCNGGDHGFPFATNFNPEINLREIMARGRYWEEGEWKETAPLEVHQSYVFPEVGQREMYLLYHEEMESLVQHLKGLQRIRFWMTFSDSYLDHLNVLQGVGMTSIEPIEVCGLKIAPLEFLKEVLPDPATLGSRTVGKTCIGGVLQGLQGGTPKAVYIYNVCDHQACYREVNAQAVSYTTGVPAMIGAQLVLDGRWKKPGVHNLETLDPDPFMEELTKAGLPWSLQEKDVLVPKPIKEVGRC